MIDTEGHDTVLREARPSDWRNIRDLLECNGLPAAGIEDRRTRFVVLAEGKTLVGCVGLESYGDQALLRSFAVREAYRNRGHGARLYEAILRRARASGIRTVVLLTETAEGFFRKQGFAVVSRDAVDERVRSSVEFESCCPASAVCMSKRLD